QSIAARRRRRLPTRRRIFAELITGRIDLNPDKAFGNAADFNSIQSADSVWGVTPIPRVFHWRDARATLNKYSMQPQIDTDSQDMKQTRVITRVSPFDHIQHR